MQKACVTLKRNTQAFSYYQKKRAISLLLCRLYFQWQK